MGYPALACLPGLGPSMLAPANLLLWSFTLIGTAATQSADALLDYRSAVERYVACDDGGRAFVAAFSANRLRELTGRIRIFDPNDLRPPTPARWPPALVAAAAAMHTHASIELRRADRDVQLAVARRLVSLLGDREAEGAAVRAWHLAVGRLILASGDVVGLIEHLLHVPDDLRNDPEVLVLRALANEMAASPLPGLEDRERLARGLARGPEWVSAQRRAFRNRAIDEYRNVLGRDPAKAEAGVRLGFLLLGDRKLQDAQQALDAARPQADDPTLRYYATLLAGRLHESRGELKAAEREYRAAAALVPHGQAPAVALAHVLILDGRRAEAVRVADALLSRPVGKDAPPRDPWLDYPLGRTWTAQEIMAPLWKAVRTCG